MDLNESADSEVVQVQVLPINVACEEGLHWLATALDLPGDNTD